MKRIDGQPVANGHRRLRIKVTAADVKEGAPLNHNSCAIAVACMRQVPHLTAAKVHLGRLYLLFEGETRWRRWYVPEYATREIVAFDRGGRFVPQEIDFTPPPVEVLARYRKPSAPRKAAPRKRRRIVHRTMDVRDSAHANEPRQG
jgi:hypothetical protein